MTTVFLRNRPHFGAQITCLPFLYSVKQIHNDQPLNVVAKYPLNWFYDQFEWIDYFHQSNQLLKDFKLIQTGKPFFNLRPKSATQDMLAWSKNATPRWGIKNKSLFLNKCTPYDSYQYRALSYLNILEVTQDVREQMLKAPFENAYQSASITLPKISNTLQILIMPGGGAGEFKKWGLENFFHSCVEIQKVCGQKMIVHTLLGPDEGEELTLFHTLKTSFPFEAQLHLKPSIADIAKLVSLSDITIANDCGPSHIAQCMQNGFIGIFDKIKDEWFFANPLAKRVTPHNGDNIKTIPTSEITQRALEVLSIKKVI